MSYKEYLSKLKGELNYIDLISYLFSNFSKLRKDDVIFEFKQKIVNITDTPEISMMEMMLESYPGHKSHSFLFREDDMFDGIFDLDFIYDELANVRVQLFANGFFSSMKMNRKYNEVLDFAKKKLGEAVEDKEFNRLIWNNKSGLIITLRRAPGVSGIKPNISFTITDKRFA